VGADQVNSNRSIDGGHEPVKRLSWDNLQTMKSIEIAWPFSLLGKKMEFRNYLVETENWIETDSYTS